MENVEIPNYNKCKSLTFKKKKKIEGASSTLVISINNFGHTKLEDSIVKIPRDVMKKLFQPQTHNAHHRYFMIRKCSNLLKK